MSNILEYTLSLQDKISAKLDNIGISSTNALNKFADLERKSKKVSELLTDMGGSVGSLREKLNLLRQEKEWIPASNITSIRAYNTEIKKLEKEITKLDTINGSAFKRNLKDAISNLPFSNLITNPVTIAGTALFGASKMAVEFDEGMSKINTTAQLSEEKLGFLKDKLKDIGVNTGANLANVPDAFEKILSQTNDVPLSVDILEKSLKGSKAGFTEQTVVAGALAQTLSLVGKENTNAGEVLDTLFAAKRLGAGEFKDFANYIPGLIASGQALGKGFKETAGVFAYMTGKGQDASQASMLIQNAYSALGKTNITRGLEKAGVSVFNKDGSMKQMDDIFTSLEIKLKSFGDNDRGKSNFLEKIGLVDMQAKQAFMVLASDSNKLKESITGVANSQGEADKAFDKSINPIQKMSMLWSKIQGLAISLGGIISSVLTPVLDGLLFVLNPIFKLFEWLFDKISKGNPIVLGLAGVIGVLTIAYYKYTIAASLVSLWAKRSAVWQGLLAVKTFLVTGATNLLTIAQTALNSAMWLNPTTWIIAGVVALIAAIAYLILKIDGWGKAWKHTVTGSKLIFNAFVEHGKWKFNSMIDGFMIGLNTIMKGWFKFKEAVGMGDSSENQKILAFIDKDTERRKKEIQEGAKKVANLYKESAAEFVKAGASLKWNNTSFSGAKDKVMNSLGIASPTVPGALPTGGGSKGNPIEKTNQSIASGGTKHNYITITINELNGLKANTVQAGKELAHQVGNSLEEQLLRVLASASTANG